MAQDHTANTYTWTQYQLFLRAMQKSTIPVSNKTSNIILFRHRRWYPIHNPRTETEDYFLIFSKSCDKYPDVHLEEKNVEWRT